MPFACSRLLPAAPPRLSNIRLRRSIVPAGPPLLLFSARFASSRPTAPRHAASGPGPLTMEAVDTSRRLADLRRLMEERNLDIYGGVRTRPARPALPWRRCLLR